MTPEDRKLLQDTHDAAVTTAALVNDHHKTLYGNGRPGLDDRVKELEVERRNCPARIAFVHGHRQTDRAARIAVAAILVSILGVIAAFLN